MTGIREREQDTICLLSHLFLCVVDTGHLSYFPVCLCKGENKLRTIHAKGYFSTPTVISILLS